MRIAGLVGLFKGPSSDAVGPDGRMALADHFREFRARLLRCLLVFGVALAVAIVFRHTIYDAVYGPYQEAQKTLAKGTSIATTSGAGAGLLLWLTLCGFAAAIVTAPYWLYQIWAFVLPGLYAQERKMSRIFVAVAGPLFLTGIVLGYVTLPIALEVLIGFNPDGVTNLIDFNDYLQFFTRTLFVFGLAFNIPVFVVLLNFAGVVKGSALKAYRPWHVHLRRRRDAVGRPLHDDPDGGPDGAAVLRFRGHRAVQRQASRPPRSQRRPLAGRAVLHLRPPDRF